MAEPAVAGSGYGVGIGWRPEISGFVAGLPGLRFAEVVAESVHAHGDLPDGLPALLDRGVAVVRATLATTASTASRLRGIGSR